MRAASPASRTARLMSVAFDAGLIEVMLTAAVLVPSRIEQPSAAPIPLVLDLVVAAGVAASGRWLITGGVIAGVGLSAWLFVPGERPTLGAVVVLVAVFAAVARGRFKVGFRLTCWYLAVMLVVITPWMPAELSALLFNVSFLVVLFGLAWTAGWLLHQRDAQVERVTGEFQARLAEQRLELARDLHDTLAQTITGMVVTTEGMRVRLGQDCPVEIANDIERVLSLGRQSITNVRAMLSVLRAPDADDQAASGWTPQSVPEVLTQQVADLKDRGFTVSTVIEGDPDTLPPSLRSCLAKVIVEATTNMAKHATPGGRCSIMIDMDAAGIEAMFSNPRSTATRQAEAGGLGLIGAAERVQAFGGQLQTRASGTQWVLTVTLPATATQLEPGHG